MGIDLNKIKEAAEKATKGPWAANQVQLAWWNPLNDEGGEPDTDYLATFDGENGPANVAYVALVDPTTTLEMIKLLQSNLPCESGSNV